MSRQILLSHENIRQSVKGDEQFVEDYSAVKEDLSATELAIDEINEKIAKIPDLFVLAGYGGIGVDAVAAIGTVDSTFKTITGFDIDLINTPKGVTYDKANNGLKLDEVGVWEFTLKVSLTFTELNAGRQIQLRSYNDTTSTPGGATFNFFVGRNQSGANLAVTLAVEVEESSVGDLIQLQVGSASDTFTSTDNIGTVYQVKHISEFQGTI